MDQVRSLRWISRAVAAAALLMTVAVPRSSAYQADSKKAAGAKIKAQSAQMDELIRSKEYGRATEIGQIIWESVQKFGITSTDFPELGNILTRVADLDHYYGYNVQSVQVLKFIVAMPDSQTAKDDKATHYEWACFRLGTTYFEGGCHRSAISWLHKAIEFAKNRKLPGGPNRGFLLENFWTLCNSYSFIGPAQADLQCHRDALELAGEDTTSQDDMLYVARAGVAELREGDAERGFRLLKKFRQSYVPANAHQARLKMNAYVDEGNTYISKGRYEDAIALADEGLAQLSSFAVASDDADSHQMLMEMHGLKSRAQIRSGRYIEAQESIYKALGKDDYAVGPDFYLDNIELLGDLARIFVHLGQLDKAYPAYILLSRLYGERAADRRDAPTPRSQIRWVAHQSAVVHELTSVWAASTDSELRKKWEPEVANALLQVKASLLLSLTLRRMQTYHGVEGLDVDLFESNREYAHAARAVLDDENEQAWMNLEDALLRREQIEKDFTRNGSDFIPAVAEIFQYEFRKLFRYQDDTALLDYSVVDFSYPKNGQRQPATKQIVVGVCLAKDRLKVMLLGSVEDLSKRIQPFLEDVSHPPSSAEALEKVLTEGREAFQSIIAPFGSLPRHLYIAPEGFLSNIPFPALVDGNRYLIEDHDVWINHSLLQRENLYRNQHNSNVADVYLNRGAVLVADPDYTGANYPALSGTRLEVEQVEQIIKDSRRTEDDHAGTEYELPPAKGDVHSYLGLGATATAVTNSRHPLVLHIAAHGEFWPGESLLDISDPPDPVDWDTNPGLLDGSLSKFDEALLRSSIVLSPDGPSSKAQSGERRLTALELSSLNLLETNLLILSACDTGVGTQSRGVGVLGFQYAVQATMVRNALLSLWRIPDQYAPKIIRRVYENWIIKHQSIPHSYTLALQELCREKSKPVHPFYWASFVLMEQSY